MRTIINVDAGAAESASGISFNEIITDVGGGTVGEVYGSAEGGAVSSEFILVNLAIAPLAVMYGAAVPLAMVVVEDIICNNGIATLEGHEGAAITVIVVYMVGVRRQIAVIGSGGVVGEGIVGDDGLEMDRWVCGGVGINGVAIHVYSAALTAEVVADNVSSNGGFRAIVTYYSAAAAVPLGPLILPGYGKPRAGAAGDGKAGDDGVVSLAGIEGYGGRMVRIAGK